MAEGLLAHDLFQAGSDLVVASAGTHAMTGGPATSHSVDVLAEQGIDISGHRSSLLTDYLLAESDLVVAMTRVHESSVAALDQDARARTFLAARCRGWADSWPTAAGHGPQGMGGAPPCCARRAHDSRPYPRRGG